MKFKRHLFFITSFFSLTFSCTKEPSTGDLEKKPSPAESAPAESTTPPLLSEEQGPISFNEHVQPILSEYCYHCHGPDSSSREPKKNPFRVDREEFAFLERDGIPMIIPGKPEESELVRLINSKDDLDVMPPANGHKHLKPHHIATIEQWIAEGAEYQEHWSFIPPQKAELPEHTFKDWAKNPIDHFVGGKLAKLHLKPSKEEERSRLLRRVSFDLTGIAPTTEQTETFVNDPRATDIVYEERIDQLLKTTAYAEHMARHWLDAARYSDTHGIHVDNYRSIWPFRDWVIQAFQENKPFDEFTIEQIAGDILPSKTLAQTVATGFNRCLPTTGEGGAILEEYDAIYAQDRVDTTSAVFLGLTTNCASCHDHKFDPISTKENYQFTAFFRNTTMPTMDKNLAEHPPIALLPGRDGDDAIHKESKKAQADLQKQFDSIRNQNKPKAEAWIKELKDEWNKVSYLPAITPIYEEAFSTEKKTTASGTPLRDSIEWISGQSGKAISFKGHQGIDLGNHANFENNQAYTVSAWIKADKKQHGTALARMDSKAAYRGWDISYEKGKIGVSLIHSWPNNAIKVSTAQLIRPDNRWYHITASYDGSSNAEGISLYINGQIQRLDILHDTLTGSTRNEASLTLGARSSSHPLMSGGIQHIKIYDDELSPQEVRRLSSQYIVESFVKRQPKKLSSKEKRELINLYFAIVPPESSSLHEQIANLQQTINTIENRGVSTLVMDEKDEEPFAHVLIRGEYSNKGERITPDTPAVLPPMDENYPKNRLGLAQWLVDGKNPLTSRVTVNRFWYYFFGRGLVETTEDFGIMGSRPSHPQLLDWLSIDFSENSWDLHHLIKTIVTSATYRQSARLDTEKQSKDPENIYLSRGPRYRLDAEQIRDHALSTSGLLQTTVGGPSVKPYQPEGIWEAVAMPQSNTRFYKQDRGAALYRRSLYTFHKRSAQQPNMEILNAPTRDVSCVRRDITNTPLQAFVTMNDVQFVEANRNLAQQALLSTKNDTDCLDFITKTLLSRHFTEQERQIVTDSLTQLHERYLNDPEKSKALTHFGQSSPDPDIPAHTLASWTVITSQVFNLDENLNK